MANSETRHPGSRGGMQCFDYSTLQQWCNTGLAVQGGEGRQRPGGTSGISGGNQREKENFVWHEEQAATVGSLYKQPCEPLCTDTTPTRQVQAAQATVVCRCLVINWNSGTRDERRLALDACEYQRMQINRWESLPSVLARWQSHDRLS